MIPTIIGPATLSWIAWVGTGLVCGLVASLLTGTRRLVVYNLVIGVISAVCGGWLSALFDGDNTPQLSIISILSALFLAALVLWLFNSLLMRNSD